MNERKILFVTCVNDEELYSICINNIGLLSVPPGYTIELLPIRGVKSLPAGYNLALKNDAKYKIYLHQDTFILNRNFLHDILVLFQSNPTLGLIGLAGCKVLPPSGRWGEGKGLVGEVVAFFGNVYTIKKFGEVNGSFEVVEAVDGFMMATQVDIPWRADLFEGFHFYDISQSAEFIKQGYLVGVPKQHNPWCLHYHTHFNQNFNHEEYEIHRRAFVQSYVLRRDHMSKQDYMYKNKPNMYFEGVNLNILKLVKPLTNVLDIGCAKGYLGAAMRKKGVALVFGIELCPEAAKEAEKKLNHVLCGDIETMDLPYQKAFFDHVIFGDVLEHLRDPWMVLQKVKPYLKSTGSIIACIPNVGHITIIHGLLEGQWAYTDLGVLDRTHLRYFTLNGIIEMFHSTGYQIIGIDRIFYTNPSNDQFIQKLNQFRSKLNSTYHRFPIEAKTHQYVVEAKVRG